MRSIKTKITVMMALIIVITVMVVTLTSVVFIRNTEHRKSDQLLLLLCETGERNLDYYFSSVERSVKDVVSYTEKELDGLEDEKLQAHMERVRSYFEIIANKTNGVLTYYYRIDPAVSSRVKGFWYTNLNGLRFTEHTVTDITEYDTSDTSKLVWFTVPKNTGKPIWLPPYITENLDVRVISYNYPIFWRGNFVGVIGIEIDHSTMAEQVESIRLYNNGYAFLTDAKGSLIFHPRTDAAMMTDGSVTAPPEGILSESTFTTYTYEGVQKEAAWLRLSNGMRLYVTIPVDETEGEWRNLINSIIFVSGITLALSILVTYLVTRRITKPLTQLTEAAKQADQGNYDFALTYDGKDEIGTLTRTFSHMAAHVRDHINDLNRRAYVDALTSVRNKGAYANYVEELQNELSMDPEKMEYAVGVFDCDDLKSVNDQCGHDKGDIYLQTASRLICRVFQHSPVFRIGGDEFSVVLRNEDYRNREKLIRAFETESARINANTDRPWEQVHVAMGIAAYDSTLDHSIIDTVRRADKIMYANKRQHKKSGSTADRHA